jgi:hypothetical protein
LRRRALPLRAAHVDDDIIITDEEAWWREMNTYDETVSVAPPPPPPPPSRQLHDGDDLLAAFPKFGPGGGDTTWSPEEWQFTPEADRARAGAGASAARVPHQQHDEAPPPPPDAAPPPRAHRAPRTLYDDLGCARGASPAALRASWARLCRRHHPDSGRDASPEAFARIMAAWERLGTGAARAAYDAELGREERLRS